MNSKYLILGGMATTLATVAAITYSMSPPVFVWVDVRTQTNPIFHCEQTQFTCESTAGIQCKILIEVGPEPGLNTIVSGRSSTCTITTGENVTPQGIYDPNTVILEVR